MTSALTESGGSNWLVASVVAVSLVIAAAGFTLDQPMLMAAAGLALPAALVAWARPFVLCALFIAFSTFRLHEAFPSLEAMKPALLLGMGAVAVFGLKALFSPLRGPMEPRSLKSYALITLALCIGLAAPYAFLRAGGTVSLDALMIPLVMVSAALCCAVWTILLSSANDRPLPRNILYFAAFFIVICITTVFSRIPGDSFDWWASITWKFAAMTLATAWIARTERDFVNASTIFIVCGLLLSAVVFYNKANGLSLVEGTRVAIGYVLPEDLSMLIHTTGKVLSDPNDLALILMFPLSFALARVVLRRNFIDAAFGLVATGAILLAITYTQSRGAAIGVMVVLAMLLLQRYRSALLGLIAIAALAPILIGAMQIATRSSGGFDEYSDSDLDQSAQHRIDAWKTAINMAAARPLTGVGISNFSSMYYSYTDYWHNRAIAAHSMWFQVLGELGVIGLALFVAMIWSSFKINAQTTGWLKQARAPPFLQATAIGLQAALAGTCASGTFLSQAYTMPIYIIVALIAALHLQASRLRADGGDERIEVAPSTIAARLAVT